MNNCLNCGKALEQIEGKREKKYCNNNCRQKYWQHTKPKKEKRKILSMAQWEEIQAQLKRTKEIKLSDLYKPSNEVKVFEQSKTNYKEMPPGLSKSEMFKWLRNNT